MSAIKSAEAARERVLAAVREWDAASPGELVLAICAALDEEPADVLEEARHKLTVLDERPPRPLVTLPNPAFTPLATEAERLELRAGDVVAVRMDLGDVREWTVRHVAWQMCGGEWVLGLGDMPGGFLLERVMAVKRGGETQ